MVLSVVKTTLMTAGMDTLLVVIVVVAAVVYVAVGMAEEAVHCNGAGGTLSMNTNNKTTINRKYHLFKIYYHNAYFVTRFLCFNSTHKCYSQIVWYMYQILPVT